MIYRIKNIKFLVAALACLFFTSQTFARELSEDSRAQIKELQEAVIARKRMRKVSESVEPEQGKVKVIKVEEKTAAPVPVSVAKEKEGVIDIGEAPVRITPKTIVETVKKEISEEEIEMQWGPEEKMKYYYNLGLAYDQGGKFEEAEAEYKKALKIDPNDPDIHYNIAIIYDDYFQDKKNAIYHYKKYLDLRPGAKDRENVKSWIRWAKQQLALSRCLNE